MADYQLAAEPRTLKGKKVKQLRRTGYVPGVIYGQEDTQNIQVNARDFAAILRAGAKEFAIDLNIDGDSRQVIVQDLQQHVTRGDLLHVDFLEVRAGQKIQVDVSLNLVGRSAPAATAQGSDILLLQQLTVETTPLKMIAELEVDASLIENPGDTLTVADIRVPEGVTILDAPDRAVAKFEPLREEITTETEEDDLMFPLEEGEELPADEQDADEDF